VGGNTTHVQLKLLPHATLLFNIQAFSVVSPALLYCIP